MRQTHYNNRVLRSTRWRECAECGQDYPMSEMVRRYDGALVCVDGCNDPRPRAYKLKPLTYGGSDTAITLADLNINFGGPAGGLKFDIFSGGGFDEGAFD